MKRNVLYVPTGRDLGGLSLFIQVSAPNLIKGLYGAIEVHKKIHKLVVFFLTEVGEKPHKTYNNRNQQRNAVLVQKHWPAFKSFILNHKES